MTQFLILTLSAFISLSALAERVDNQAKKIAGINEKVTISYMNGVWTDSSGAANGAQGKVIKKIIPVTELAFNQLGDLDKSGKYECLIGKSTADKVGHVPV